MTRKKRSETGMTLWICRPPTGKILFNRGNESTEKCELGDDGKVASLQNRRIWRMSTFIQWRVGMKKEKVLSFGGSQQTGWLSGKNFWLFVDNFLTTDGPATSLSLSRSGCIPYWAILIAPFSNFAQQKKREANQQFRTSNMDGYHPGVSTANEVEPRKWNEK